MMEAILRAFPALSMPVQAVICRAVLPPWGTLEVEACDNK